MLEKRGLERHNICTRGTFFCVWKTCGKTAFDVCISRPLPSFPPYVSNMPPCLSLSSPCHTQDSGLTMVTQDGSIPATENAFTQALHQPTVVKDQFDLLYASLCQEGENDDDGSSCSSSRSVSPPRHRRRSSASSVSNYAEESEDEEEDKHQRASATAAAKATATKKRQRASSDIDEGKPQRRAPPLPLPPRYDEEELRHSWKPLAPAGDDYMELSATISSARRRKAASAAAPARRKGAKATVGAKSRCSGEGEAGNSTTYSFGPLGGEWLQTRKAVVSERTSVVPKHASTNTAAIPAVRASSPATANATPSTTAKASHSLSSIDMLSDARSSGSTGSSNTNTGQHSRTMGTFFSPRPRFLGLSPESGGGSGGLGGSGGSLGCKKRPVTGTARATTMGVGSACRSSLGGGMVSSSGGNRINKGLPPSALFNVLKKSIFSPKAH